MSVDFDLFYDWACEHFGEHNIKVKHTAHGDEICTHSFFAKRILGEEDHKFHLWMNPDGGKQKREGGVYRCWLTDSMGSLISLVAEEEGIDYEDAEERISSGVSLRTLEQRVHEFFGCYEEGASLDVIEEEPKKAEMELPDFSFLIDKMSPGNFWRIRARQYLNARKIPTDGLYVCTEGDYKNRIIIPYYDREENLVFWNGRLMNDKEKTLRYAKPVLGDQNSVLFMTDWPEPGSKVYVMEGELDAITLGMADLTGAACGGKFLSDIQVALLMDYEPVLSFDADPSGRKALVDNGQKLLEWGFPKIWYVRPPEVYKDWNKLLQVRNLQTVKAYIERFEKRFTSDTAAQLLANRLDV